MLGEHSSNPVPFNDEPFGSPEVTAYPQDFNREAPRDEAGNQEPGKHPAFRAQEIFTNPSTPGCDNTLP